MKKPTLTSLISMISMVGVSIAPTYALEPLSKVELMPFLETYCIDCHGPEKEEGDIRFDTIDWDISDPDTAEIWSYVLGVVEDKEMPPEEEPQPTEAIAQSFTSVLGTRLEDALTPPTEAVPIIDTKHANGLITPIDHDALKPFLAQHCISCHGPDKQKGQVRFDTIAWEISNNDMAQRWQDVLDVLNGGEMPPEEKPRPSKEELVDVLNVLTQTLNTARMRLTDNGGVITMRRLNKREYSNTIRDLFGFNVSPHLIPEDGESESFDTVGKEQFFSSVNFEQYLELGRFIATNGFKWSGKPLQKAEQTRHEPENRPNASLRKSITNGEKYVRMKAEGKTWKQMGFNDEGGKETFFRQIKSRFYNLKEYMDLPRVDEGLYLSDLTTTTLSTNFSISDDPRASYRIRMRGGIHGTPPDLRKYVHINNAETSQGVLKMRGTTENPEIEEMIYTSNLDKGRRNQFTVNENRPPNMRRYSNYLKRIDPDGEPASIWIDWIEVEGPFYRYETNVFGGLLQADGVRGDLASDATAGEFIERFCYEAFRRDKPEEDYISMLHALFQKYRNQGKNFEDAMGEVIAIILTSPSFLYIEEENASPRTRKLDDRAFAIRLAYFLWSSPPDDELYLAARSGSLSDHTLLKAQVDRMLDDPKADAFFEGFVRQWAELERFEAITVDAREHYEFSEGVRLSAYQEVLEFFKTLVREDLPVDTLIDSDFVVVNSLMADYYGIDGVDSNEFIKVALDRDSPRGGFLTQTAFLTLGSNGERSSPVIRGSLILEKILNDKPPPPPPNVPELGSESDEPLTNREMVEMHRSQVACASCHNRIDPIGFGFENFDTVGRWREREALGNTEVRIDSGGTLVSGTGFRDLPDLKRLLVTQKHKLAKELIESMLAYGLGRTVEFSDANTVEEILNRCQYTDYGLRTIIHKVASSRLFYTK